MEAEAKEPTGVTRGQNAVHVMPLDWSAAARVLSPLVERIDSSRAETQLLVVTADSESAVSAAGALVAVGAARAVRVLAATSSPRAARLLKSSPPHVVCGAPAELVALLQSSALKSESVRGVVLGWLDPILGTPDAQPLEVLLGELPKEGARIVFAAELTPAHEALVERYARRARRVAEPAGEPGAPLSAEYVAASPAARAVALRRLLDALDPTSATLYARDETTRAEAEQVARLLGYPIESVRTIGGAEPTAGADPLVLLDLPATREEMRALAGASGRKLYAIVQPSQLASLRALLGGGTVSAVSLLEAAERARGKDAALRASLRDVLASSDVRREVLAIEPLLAEFDGIEIAAAALKMLEQQRPARPTATVSQTAPMTALFVNLGEKDGVRPQELVAAVTSASGIPGSQVGKVEVRDNHSIVEIASSVAELVAGKLTGSVVRGRRVQARVDQPREARGAPPRGAPRGDRPERSGPPRSGPPRGDRPVRSFDRGDRPPRPGAPRSGPPRGDRPDRPARPFTRDAGPKKPFDRSAGGERRPTRPAGPPRPRRDDA
ncbi:MAG TPA: DbpA RNA binding domain-containing protein [Gemmatimonadaceae bacterium]|nr:DbpA RNA binding domain-containing protein [Gemmatimonadaceae bacterium]